MSRGDVEYHQRKDGLWEQRTKGTTTGLYRELDTKPPKWVGNDASTEAKTAWEKEAKRKMALADAPGVVMFFAAGKGPIPNIVFAEPVEEENEQD